MVGFKVLVCLLFSAQEYVEVGGFTTPKSRSTSPTRPASTTTVVYQKPNGADDWMSSVEEQPWSNVGGGKSEKRPNIPRTPASSSSSSSSPSGGRTNTKNKRGVTYERVDVQKWKEENNINNREMEDFISGAKYYTNKPGQSQQGQQSKVAGSGLGRKPVSGGGNIEQKASSSTGGGDGRFVRYNRKRDGDMLLGSNGEASTGRARGGGEAQRPRRPGGDDKMGQGAYVDSQTGTRYERYDKSQKSMYMDPSADEFIQRVNNPPPQGGGDQRVDPTIEEQQLSSGFTGFSGIDFSQRSGAPNPVQQQQPPPQNPPQPSSRSTRRPRMPDNTAPNAGAAEPRVRGLGDLPRRDESFDRARKQNYNDAASASASAGSGSSSSSSSSSNNNNNNNNIFDSIFELLENQLRQLESNDPKSDLRMSREENAKLMSQIDDLKARTMWKRQEIERLKQQVSNEQRFGEERIDGNNRYNNNNAAARDDLKISREENAMLKKELESLKARAAWKRKQIEMLKAKLTDESRGGGGFPAAGGFGGVDSPELYNESSGDINDPVLKRSKQETKKLQMEIEEMKARTEWKRNEIERLRDKVANDNINNDLGGSVFESVDEVKKDLKLSREENTMLKKEAEHLEARAAWKRKEIQRLKAQIAKQDAGPAKTRDLLRLQYLGASMDSGAELPPTTGGNNGRREGEEQGFLTDFSGLEELDSFQRDAAVESSQMRRPRQPPPRMEPPPQQRYNNRAPYDVDDEQERQSGSNWEAFYGTKREQESKREQLSSGRFQRSTNGNFPRRPGANSGGGERKPVLPRRGQEPNSQQGNTTLGGRGTYSSSSSVKKPVLPRPSSSPREPWSTGSSSRNVQRPPVDGWDTAFDRRQESFEGGEVSGWDGGFPSEETPQWVEQRANTGRQPNNPQRPSSGRELQRPGADAMFRDWPDNFDVPPRTDSAASDGRKSPGFVGFSDNDYGEDGGNYVAPS